MARKARKAPAPSAPSRRPPAGRPVLPLLGVAAVLAVAVAYVLFTRRLLFTQDDAYISFRYAKHLIEGHGLVFNPGERVEGYSNFLWTLLVAAAMKLQYDPVPASQVLGIAFGVLALLTAARFVRGLEGRWGVGAVAAAAFVGMNPAFELWSNGGLETAMFAFLAVAGLERGLAPDVGPRGRRLAPFLLAAASLTRPEGPLLFALYLGVRAFDTWRGGPCADADGRRGLVLDAARFAAILVPYAAFKLLYFGDLLPNPFYAKTGWSLEHLRLGVAYAGDFLGAYGFWGISLVAGGACVLAHRGRGVEARLLAIWLAWAAYVVLIGGDVLYQHRFWLHVLPLGAVLLGRGVTELARRIPGLAAPAARAAAGLVLAATLAGAGFLRNVPAALDRREAETGFVLNMRQTGEWLHDNLPADATIATTTIGAISYYSGVRVIDMLGLTDREVARHPRMLSGITDNWREVQYNAESVLRRRPDMIFFSTSVRPSSAAEKALFFYPWFLENYYAYYFRSKSWRESLQNGFRLRPDAAPFDSTQVPEGDARWVDAYSEGHIAKSRDRDAARAIPLFREAVDKAPVDFLWAKEWLGVTCYDAGDTTAALPLLLEVARDSCATIALGRLAEWAVRHERGDEAEAIFRKILAVDPDDNLPWIGLAEAARSRHDLDTAYRYSTEAMRRWDTNPVHLMLHGTLALAAGDLGLAEASFRRSLSTGADEDTAGRARQGLELLDLIRQGRVNVADVRAAIAQE